MAYIDSQVGSKQDLIYADIDVDTTTVDLTNYQEGDLIKGTDNMDYIVELDSSSQKVLSPLTQWTDLTDYYTKSEVDTSLNLKADITYVDSENQSIWTAMDEFLDITELTSVFYNKTEVYTKQEIDEQITEIEDTILEAKVPYVSSMFPDVISLGSTLPSSVTVEWSGFSPHHIFNLDKNLYSQTLISWSSTKLKFEIQRLQAWDSPLTEISFSNHDLWPNHFVIQIQSFVDELVYYFKSFSVKSSIIDNSYLNGADKVVVYEQNDSLYAILTTYHGDDVTIYNIDDLDNPVFLDTFGSATYTNGARDVQVYTQGSNMYAAMTSQLNSQFVIFDITDPTNIILKDYMKDTSNISYAFALQIYTQGTTIYAAVTGAWGDEFAIFDITDPTDITMLGTYYSNANIDNSESIEVYTQDGKRYAAVWGSTGDEFSLFDITDPTNIIFLANYYSNAYLDGILAMSIYTQNDETHLAAASEIGDEIAIFNIHDPNNIEYLGGYISSTFINGPFDIDTYEEGGNFFAGVAANMGDDFTMFDITDPANVILLDILSDPAFDGASGVDFFEKEDLKYAAIASFNEDALVIVEIEEQVVTP